MTCVKCGNDGTFSHQHKVCNTCRGAKNKEAISKSVKSYLQRSLTSARERAKKRQIPCTITLDDLLKLWTLQNGRCAVSKVAMTYGVNGQKMREFNVSIDQIRANAGYTPQNVQLVCARVNFMKHELDMNDLQWWIRTLYAAMEP